MNVAGIAAKNIKEGLEINDKLNEFRKSLAGGELVKMLDKVGKGPVRDYERQMQVNQVKRE